MDRKTKVVYILKRMGPKMESRVAHLVINSIKAFSLIILIKLKPKTLWSLLMDGVQGHKATLGSLISVPPLFFFQKIFHHATFKLLVECYIVVLRRYYC